MKTLLRLLPLLVVSLCTTQIFAQPSEADMKKMKAQAKLMPIMMKMFIKIQAEGKGLGMTFVEDGDDAEFQKLTGTTNEQFGEFYDFMMNLKSKVKPQMEPLMLAAADTDDPAKIEEIGNKIETLLGGVYDQVSAKLEETVTPQQMMKLRQLELQMTGPMAEAGFPMVNFEAYTALDLTPAQKEKLDKIRTESEAEQLRFMDELSKIMPKPGKPPKPEEMKAFQEKMAKTTEAGKKLIAKIKSRILVILDKKQEAKLEQIMKNVPQYVKSKQGPPQPPAKPVDEKKFDAWKDAWKPGDPIPDEFRQEEKSRRRAFPSMR